MKTLGIINDNGQTIPHFLETNINDDDNDFELQLLIGDNKFKELVENMFHERYKEDYEDFIEEDFEPKTELKDKVFLDVVYMYVNCKNIDTTMELLKKYIRFKFLIIETHKNLEDKFNIIINTFEKHNYHISKKIMNVSKFSDINFNKEHLFITISKTKFDLNDIEEEDPQELIDFRKFIEKEKGLKSKTGQERNKIIDDIKDRIDSEKDIEFFIWKKSYGRKIKSCCLPGLYEETKTGSFNIQSIPFFCYTNNIEDYKYLHPMDIAKLHGCYKTDIDFINKYSNQLGYNKDNISNYYYYVLSCPLYPILDLIIYRVRELEL